MAATQPEAVTPNHAGLKAITNYESRSGGNGEPGGGDIHRRRPDLDDAIEAALSFAGRLSHDEFMQTRAGRQVTKARQWVSWYAVTHLAELMSQREIGKRMGCAHSTVVAAASRVERHETQKDKARFCEAVRAVVRD